MWCLDACDLFSLDPLCCSWERFLCPPRPSPLLSLCDISANFPLFMFTEYWLPPGLQKLLESKGQVCCISPWVSCARQVTNRKTSRLFSQHHCWQTLEALTFEQQCWWTVLWASFSVPMIVRKWHLKEAFPSNLKGSHSFCLVLEWHHRVLWADSLAGLHWLVDFLFILFF